MKIEKCNGRCNISGVKLKTMRKKAGLSQEKFAAKIQLAGLSINQKAISRIETGDRIVTDYELVIFAKALGVSMDMLTGA